MWEINVAGFRLPIPGWRDHVWPPWPAYGKKGNSTELLTACCFTWKLESIYFSRVARSVRTYSTYHARARVNSALLPHKPSPWSGADFSPSLKVGAFSSPYNPPVTKSGGESVSPVPVSSPEYWLLIVEHRSVVIRIRSKRSKIRAEFNKAYLVKCEFWLLLSVVRWRRSFRWRKNVQAE